MQNQKFLCWWLQAATAFLKQQTNDLTEQGLQWASQLEVDLAEKERDLDTIRHNHQQAQAHLKVRSSIRNLWKTVNPDYNYAVCPLNGVASRCWYRQSNALANGQRL